MVSVIFLIYSWCIILSLRCLFVVDNGCRRLCFFLGEVNGEQFLTCHDVESSW